MSDALSESTALLAKLLSQITKETDPVKYDEISAEIRCALEERERLKQSLNQEKH